MFDRRSGGKHLHLADGNFVEAFESFPLWQLHVNEFGVHALDIGQHQQLFDGGVFAHVAFKGGVGVAPLFGCLAEEGDIEQVRLGGIGDGGLGGRNRSRNQVRSDGVGVDAVVELGKGAVQVPGQRQAAVFILLEALEFLDQVELEFDRYPGGEFKGDVLVGVSAAVASGVGNQPDGLCFLDPLFRGESEAVQPGLHFKPVEFDGIKTRVVELLPDAEKFHGVSVSDPVAHKIVGTVGVLDPGDVRKADEVLFLLGQNGDSGPLYLDGRFAVLSHGFSLSATRGSFFRPG